MSGKLNGIVEGGSGAAEVEALLLLLMLEGASHSVCVEEKSVTLCEPAASTAVNETVL